MTGELQPRHNADGQSTLYPFANMKGLFDAVLEHFATPEQLAELNSEDGLGYDPANIQLFGTESNFSHAFDGAFQPRKTTEDIDASASQSKTKIYPHKPAIYPNNTYAITEADSFTTPIIDLIPAKTVLVTGKNIATHAWQQHTWNVIQQTDTPRDYLNNLWGNEKIHQALEAAGHTKESVLAAQRNEAILLGRRMHFLRSQERFNSVKAMLAGKHPDQKEIVRLPFDITKKGFQDRLTTALPDNAVVSYANIGTIGDADITLAASVVAALPLHDPVEITPTPFKKRRRGMPVRTTTPGHFIQSTQVRFENDPDGWMDTGRPPEAFYYGDRESVLASIFRGMYAVNAFNLNRGR